MGLPHIISKQTLPYGMKKVAKGIPSVRNMKKNGIPEEIFHGVWDFQVLVQGVNTRFKFIVGKYKLFWEPIIIVLSFVIFFII